MNEINLYNQNLTELTEEDLISLCHLNNIKPIQLTELYLTGNNLTNIDFIQENTPFINLKQLYLNYNKIFDISNIKYLVNLKHLNIEYNENLTDITNIKYLTKLEVLYMSNSNLKNEKKILKILRTIKTLKILECNYVFKSNFWKNIEKELPNIVIL